jgi:hypothetical protein
VAFLVATKTLSIYQSLVGSVVIGHYKKNWKLQQMDSNSFVELPVILKQN